MPAKPVQISLEGELLQRIDQDPETRRRGRSAFIRSAVELYLRVKDRERLEAQIAQAYGGQGDVMAAEISALIEAQAWPRD